ncbi:MAG TPA: PTS sugar transporter subunit IIC [Gemmatimonadaceae bacterium]|nr:PTS sugar transporter subunit IIC [Gemmatimonadaceae bacterium]
MTAVVDFLPLALLGAVLGLDVVAFPQAMTSRPLVAATLGGALAGNAGSGLVAGAALELIALETLPFGASRYPEWGSAAVVGGALFATHADIPAPALVTAVLAAIATGWVGGWTMIALRRLNAAWARRRREGLERGSWRTVAGLQLFGLTADLVRGGLLTLGALLALDPVVRASLALFETDARLSRAFVTAVTGTVAAAAMWKILHATPHAVWYLAGGLLIGFALLRGLA